VGDIAPARTQHQSRQHSPSLLSKLMKLMFENMRMESCSSRSLIDLFLWIQTRSLTLFSKNCPLYLFELIPRSSRGVNPPPPPPSPKKYTGYGIRDKPDCATRCRPPLGIRQMRKCMGRSVGPILAVVRLSVEPAF
jgi:hypothetical protein